MNAFPLRALQVAAIASVAAVGLPLLGCGSDDEAIPFVDENQVPNQQDQQEGTELLELFDESVEMNSGFSETLALEVPENVLSMSITISEGPISANYTVTDWVGPEEFEIIRPGWVNSTSTGICYPDCNNRVVMINNGATAALAPNNPDSQVEAGTHEFRVFGGVMGQTGFSPSVSQPVRVQVFAKVTDEAPETGILDLNLFFTGVNGWTAETAQQDTSFQNTLDSIDNLYSTVGISLGEVSYNDVDSSFQVIESMEGANSDLNRLFQLSEDAPLDGPNLFIVDELRSSSPFGGGGGILGISGGIPGPILAHGTPQSGVAVAYGSIQGAAILANVMAHELGHYLGLFHTSEYFAFGGMPGHDPLPDTPEDDTSYLMHAGGSGGNMSEWQGKVMRKNPWVRHDDQE